MTLSLNVRGYAALGLLFGLWSTWVGYAGYILAASPSMATVMLLLALVQLFLLVVFCVWVSDVWRKAPEVPQRPQRALLHDRYALSKVPTNLDAVIIGSGMSGLSCAAILARLGRKVVVLEQHDRAGGGTHTYDFQGYIFDSGLHYTVPWSVPIFELTCASKSVPKFDLMGEPDGTFDRITLGSESEFRMQHGEKHLPTLYSMFPDERKAIDKYIETSNAAMTAVKIFIASKLLPKWLQKVYWKLVPERFTAPMKVTAEQLLQQLTSNKHLISLLSSMFIDTGARPDKASFMLTASVFRGMAMEGAAYPRGGGAAMASVLVPVIEKHGGRVLVRAAVDQINFENGHVSGIRMTNGDEIRCRNVISSCAYHNTFQRLVPEEITKAYNIPRQLKVPDSAGFVMCNIGIKAAAEEVGVTSANSWYVPVDEHKDLFPPLRAFFEEPLSGSNGNSDGIPCFITFPSMKDVTWSKRNPGKTSCQILVMAHYEWFQQWAEQPSGSRGADYEAVKDAWKERCLQSLYRAYPMVEGKVDFVDLSTPLSIEYYLRAPRGGAVGLDVTPERFCDWQVQRYLDVVTDVPGLFLTGQDTLICGVTLCQLAGVITAARMAGPLGLVKILTQAIFMT